MSSGTVPVSDGSEGFTAVARTNLGLPAGTKSLFQQTSAPTGWTKDTTHNDKALRIVSGTASTGGSVAFTTAFASQSVAGTVGGTAITINQMPLHGHPMRLSINANNDSHEQGALMVSENDQTNFSAFTGTPAQTAGQQIGGTGGGATHDHSFTGTAINLAVAYVDVILATKD
jgi:microcystin-dependent protein